MTCVVARFRNTFVNAPKCRCAAIVLVCLGVCARAGSAQDTTEAPIARTDSAREVVELGTIVVTAPREKPAATAHDFSAAQIEAAGAHTLDEALAMTPGVMVGVSRKGEAGIMIRGISANRVQVLIDGRSVNNPYYGHVDLSTLDLDNAARVKVVSGPPSVLYGTGGIGGVVNIITREPVGDGELRVEGSGLLGNNTTYRLGTKAEMALEGWGLLITANKSASDGYSLSRQYETDTSKEEDGGLRDNSDYDRYNVTGKLTYTVGDRGDMALSAGYFSEERGIPWSEIPPADFRRFVDWKRYYADIMGRTDLWTKAWLKGKMFFDAFDNRMVAYVDAQCDSVLWDSFHEHWDVGGVAQLHQQLGAGELVWGINAKHEEATTEGYLDEPREQSELNTVSTALEYVVRPLRGAVSMRCGASVSRAWSYSVAGVGLDAWSVDAMLDVKADIRGLFEPYGAVGVYTLYPTLRQLYSDDNANPNLRPERSLRTEVGLRAAPFDWARITAAGFNDIYWDMIDRPSRNEPYANYDRAVTRGLEAAATTAWGRTGSRLTASYGYTHTSSDDSLPLRYFPAHKIGVAWTQTFLRGGRYYFGGQWVVGRVDEQGRETTAMADYFVARTKLSYRWKALRAALTVDNVFDKHYYTEEDGYPMPGRSYSAELGFTLGTKVGAQRKKAVGGRKEHT